jgi:hypothetical protein
MKENKKIYQLKILEARRNLRDGLVINAYDVLGSILDDMEKA